jgi:SSS family solute:Na+ symporter
MVGYIGIGFLTLGKAVIPMLPESFSLFGSTIPITLMGAVIVIAIITGIYITFGGQTAVIFTDLLQGFILLFAGFFLFFLGLSYVGGFDVFWNVLPTEWKMPLAHFNDPSSFNFVGIFWQDGVAGSVGFLFMNMGLIMRFMATKSVNEGRKAATFNILFMLPLSAIVVGNAGWIGKAISISSPEVVPPNTSPDQIFVVIANIVATPGVFGFIMAALTAALMSTVDTLINATAAIYINDVYRPLRKFFKKSNDVTDKKDDKRELNAARYASVVITTLGVLAVLAFKNFPTVYEAHGYFHSTLTPPLVVAIFLGLFWRKFSPAAVITTFVAGVALMIVGLHEPSVISPFDHGIEMNESHPYSYIRALYNIIVCLVIAVGVTLTINKQKKISAAIRDKSNANQIIYGLTAASILIFVLVLFDVLPIYLQIVLIFVMAAFVAVISTYLVKYDEEKQIDGLTVWSVNKAKEMFKGSKLNEEEGEVIKVSWKVKEHIEDIALFSKNDMQRMKANAGDLVYLCDARKIFGGLKSVHTVFGEPHEEDGVVYISNEDLLNAQFVKGKPITAEKEM